MMIALLLFIFICLYWFSRVSRGVLRAAEESMALNGTLVKQVCALQVSQLQMAQALQKSLDVKQTVKREVTLHG